jgi:Leucine-rich repeat (LRR) protein
MLSRINEERKRSLTSHQFCFGCERLTTFPITLFTYSGIEMLKRLDLSYNNISEIPLEIGLLTNLRSLWISNNPIKSLPGSISSLTKIEDIDIRKTLISEVPLCVSVFEELHDFDWRDTPMAANFKETYNILPGDLKGLKDLLSSMHEREEIEKEFIDLLENVAFIKEGTMISNFHGLVTEYVHVISAMFGSTTDFRSFLRRYVKQIF